VARHKGGDSSGEGRAGTQCCARALSEMNRNSLNGSEVLVNHGRLHKAGGKMAKSWARGKRINLPFYEFKPRRQPSVRGPNIGSESKSHHPMDRSLLLFETKVLPFFRKLLFSQVPFTPFLSGVREEKFSQFTHHRMAKILLDELRSTMFSNIVAIKCCGCKVAGQFTDIHFRSVGQVVD
jgi:hypothetical protein